MRESDGEERAILEALENGVSDTDPAAMLRDLAAVLRGKGGHIGARVTEIAADRLTNARRQD